MGVVMFQWLFRIGRSVNSENRISKSETKPKHECANDRNNPRLWCLRNGKKGCAVRLIWILVIRYCFEFRISCFEFLILKP